jgi:RimJ/RimL family protein N-acetyltransferase
MIHGNHIVLRPAEERDLKMDFFLRPSARNRRAIAAYERAGFKIVPITIEEQVALYRPGDYHDPVLLMRYLPAEKRTEGGSLRFSNRQS